jgi:uncharacterized membrane protein YcaP (DUF421 family)
MDIVIRAAFIFFFILLLTRVVGRRELSSMEPFDLILLVVIGDLVQQGVTQNDFSVVGAVLAITTMGMLTVLVSWAGWRWRVLRPVLEGEPIILVQDGEPIKRNLDRNRITVDEVAAAAREQQVEKLDGVRWAVLETNGRISIIPKQ